MRLSADRALRNNLKPNVKAMAIGYNKRCLHIIVYVNSIPNEDDFETVSDIAGEIICDFPELIRKTKEECRYLNESNIKRLDCWFQINE